ncbi:hypothetical protein K6V78_05175 [Streptococcus gallolyticus]|uniref:hypothetical protein n=1 Tax=Streptococcus hepaticus TaxID=3349163 RepID=UPI001C9635EC|nr:hypothetical protein [Streptococcus gallolyticus]MBY5042093.1 hypothetical protein [Streptococcus gallolyticus]
MAFVFSEDIVESVVKEVNEANPGFQFDWQTYLLVSQQSGRTATAYILVENPYYIALIQVGTFDVKKVTDIHIIAKSQIQGFKLKRGVIQNILKIRMKNGAFYKLRFRDKAGKKLPLHAQNAMQYKMDWPKYFADRFDMKDYHTSVFSEIGTWLLIILMFIISIIIMAITDSKLIGIAVLVGLLAGTDWISNKLKSRKIMNADAAFFKEAEAIEQNAPNVSFEETYQAMKHCQPQPTTMEGQTAYYSRLVQMAHYLGYDDEAHRYTEMIPRDYSKGAEQEYLACVNYLATPIEEEVSDSENSLN